MTLQQLKTRQQTLLNLIAKVGGKNNIRKWVDELMSVEAKIEELEAQSLSGGSRRSELCKKAVPAVQVVYIDDADHLTQPWTVIVSGKEVARFATRMKCDRHLAWKGLQAA
ncbi:hypothetical protein [aff. Roholtiella sp. LEGE 12411]|uniref:hypothetical protein n=1 Tax=aff. Roholtiella sp. LEGE 12411 TaxID=1828822 RepID=UPI00187EAC41|nr:hypothetical protein [aff. Roholtiella sp. LEGE 12411]MBE9038339.1 hypothetical protein [aff. Roholtiella sp. LEGE 12411]